MKTVINQSDLLGLLTEQLPETRQVIGVLPPAASIYTILYKLYEATSLLVSRNNFKAVKRCLLLAEQLFLQAEPRIADAVSTIYIYHLSKLLDKRDARSEVIRHLLPPVLRAEYSRQLNACLP